MKISNSFETLINAHLVPFLRLAERILRKASERALPGSLGELDLPFGDEMSPKENDDDRRSLRGLADDDAVCTSLARTAEGNSLVSNSANNVAGEPSVMQFTNAGLCASIGAIESSTLVTTAVLPVPGSPETYNDDAGSFAATTTSGSRARSSGA